MRADAADRERTRKVLLLALATVLGLLLVLFLWQSARAVIALDRAGSTAPLLAAQVGTGDVDGARASLDLLTDQVGQAHDNTDNPLWAVASWFPIVGDDVEAVRTLAREMDVVVTEALPGIVDVADQVRLDSFTPRDGRIDLDAVREAAPVVQQTRAVLERVNPAVQDIETEGVFGRLRVPLRDMQDSLDSATQVSRVADVAGELLPTMLGGEGRRRYLLLIQNNAEARSLGGIPGSVAVLDANRGKVSMGRQGSASDVQQVDSPVVDLTEGERSVFPPTLGTDIRNVVFTPDYPRAAQIAADLVGDAFDTEFDGVISVDPVTLAYVLGGIGPVQLDDGTELTSTNAVGELLNNVYLRYPTDLAAQDAVFEDAARRIFDAFVAGAGDTQGVLEGLVRAASDNRVLVWATDAADQERIARTGIAGSPSGGPSAPRVGVYLNDSMGSKMQYYLDATSGLRPVECVDDDAQRLELTTTLRSAAPADAATLPLSITGLGDVVPRGDQRLNVRVFAPEGGRIERLVVGGEEQPVVGGDLDGRRVAIVPVTLGPGDIVTISATLRSGPGQTGRAVLTTTPGVQPTANDVRTASACS